MDCYTSRCANSIRRRLLQIGLCMECLGTGMEFVQDSNQVSYNGIYGGWKAVSQIAIEVKFLMSLASCEMYDRSYIA
jgi:hypothetical protein